jgi:hypothetical protein
MPNESAIPKGTTNVTEVLNQPPPIGVICGLDIVTVPALALARTDPEPVRSKLAYAPDDPLSRMPNFVYPPAYAYTEYVTVALEVMAGEMA